MMKFNQQSFFTTICSTLVAGSAMAHDGRRFDIQVVDGQIVAQGYISGSSPVDDGNGLVREYYNAIHAHWENIAGIVSRSTLPGFDLHHQDGLEGGELWLTVLGVKKWDNAPFADFAGGGHGGHGGGHVHPHFMAIPANEWIEVGFNGSPLSVGTPLLLDASVGLSEHFDLSFDFQSGDPLAGGLAPTNAIYVVELKLSSSNSGIADSGTIHAILSPSGIAGSHGLSLATEIALGTPVPEPTTLAFAALLPLLMRRRRA